MKISFLAFPLMKCEQILDEGKTDWTDRPTSRLGDLGDIIGNRRSRSRPKIENPQIAMSCTYTELRGHTRERYLTSQMLRPSQAHGSPFVGQSGEAREPSGTRRTASPTERNSSSGHWATTHPGGRSGKCEQVLNEMKIDSTDIDQTPRFLDLGDIIGNRRGRSRLKIDNPQIAMSHNNI